MLCFARDNELAKDIAVITMDISNVGCPPRTADYLATTTLVVILTKGANEIQIPRNTTGADFLQPSRSLAMSCLLGKLAYSCVSTLDHQEKHHHHHGIGPVRDEMHVRRVSL